MSVNDAQARISKVAKDLGQQWRELREQWQDENAESFERNYIEPLENELRKTKLAMEQMAALIARIKSDCS